MNEKAIEMYVDKKVSAELRVKDEYGRFTDKTFCVKGVLYVETDDLIHFEWTIAGEKEAICGQADQIVNIKVLPELGPKSQVIPTVSSDDRELKYVKQYLTKD